MSRTKIYLAFLALGFTFMIATLYATDDLNLMLFGKNDTIQKHYRRNVNEYEDLIECYDDDDCNHGKCEAITDFRGNYLNASECICNKGYIDNDNKVCIYKQRKQLVAFLLSFFVGNLGVDWFYLAHGNGVYIFAGIMKLITLGGCGIWWIVDWIRILIDEFPDGNRIALQGW
jgi:hypothetical protein